MKKEEDDNIIPFPRDKKSSHLKLVKNKKEASQAPESRTFGRNEIVILASLAAIFCLVTVLNRSLDVNQVTAPVVERGVASEPTEVSKINQLDEDNRLATYLADTKKRNLASIGRKPTPRESFLYGSFLKYKDSYEVVFDEREQFLVNMKYIPSSHEMLKMTPEVFFQSYRSIFPHQVVGLRPKGEFLEISGGLKERTYYLLDKVDGIVSEVKITMANGEYLYSYQEVK